MSYISPNGTIKLLRDVPLDSDYNHTLYWSRDDDLQGVAEQEAYFNSKAKYTFTNQSYSRVGNRTLRVRIDVGNVYGCNYLMFKNTGYIGDDKIFENKWFFAFISEINYVNNGVTDIVYEIDVMQTWYFNFRRKQCLVERETVAHDSRYNYTLPEPVETGDYVINNITEHKFEAMDAVVCHAFEDTDEKFAKVFNNMVSGCKYQTVSTDDMDNISNYFRNLTEQQRTDSVVSIYMVPREFLPEHSQSSEVQRAVYTAPENDVLPIPQELNEYKPRNLKLFTYPYNFIQLSDNSGNAVNYRYEWFNAGHRQPNFRLSAISISSPQVLIRPENYKGVEGDNFDETFLIDSFPQCAFTMDTYRAWVASGGRFENRMALGKSALSYGQSVANSIAGVVGSLANIENPTDVFGKTAMAGTNAIFGGVNLALDAWSTVKRNEIMDERGNTVKGNNSSSIAMAMRKKHPTYYNKCIRAEYAKIIDDFFTVYGYKIMQLKVPEFKNRTEWTYVKTINFEGVSHVPAPDYKKICSIMDKGITFWTNPDHVGDYSIPNNEL